MIHAIGWHSRKRDHIRRQIYTFESKIICNKVIKFCDFFRIRKYSFNRKICYTFSRVFSKLILQLRLGNTVTIMPNSTKP